MLSVKVVPAASRSAIMNVHNGGRRVAITAQPEKGKANKALIKYLAGLLDVPPRSITVQKGLTTPHKLLLLEGLQIADVLEKLKPS